MKITPKAYAQTLLEVIETTDPKHHNQVLDNFVKVLVENNDLKLMAEISEEWHKLELANKGMKLAEVRSAHELSQGQEKELIETLNGLLKSNVELKTKIDEGLIGGVVVKIEDKVIDASVKNNLQELRTSLEE